MLNSEPSKKAKSLTFQVCKECSIEDRMGAHI